MSELDLALYTERVAGYAMPEIEEGIVGVELTDWDDNRSLYSVPSQMVQSLNMPRLSPNIPDYVKEPFEKGIGLALVACRILNTYEDLVSLEIPTEPPSTIVVPLTRLDRKV